jgi:serine phosphatase RsbU (regulator of sigma subunit)/pSer/pThr/pTyr-binding forkhead associated (FHA) protein
LQPSAPSPVAEPASLVVIDPGGHRTRLPLQPLPFRIGRHADNHLIIRDTRASRTHARIFVENGEYWIEDCGSRHGTWVNQFRVERRKLHNSDRVHFGAQDSYQLVFALDGAELKRLMEHVAAPEKSGPAGLGANLAKLRAILDLARTLQSSFSINDVLASVVDTALAITGAERGFLLLRGGEHLETRVARNAKGQILEETELRVPRQVLHQAQKSRRELLTLNFDPVGAEETGPLNTIADLELRSVICVPLVRIRAGQGDETSRVITSNETVGLLYMDSRLAAADLAGGNRELLQTLAIEASTVLENARLLEEERAKHRLEEELTLARTIQRSLLPASLPGDGWLRACGSSVPSLQVGGDYYDVTQVTPQCWAAVVADVSGKGVASSLLASLLQGALITATDVPQALARRVGRLNQFLIDRTGGEKYATLFYALVHAGGAMNYVNAAHCPPMVVRGGGAVETLEATGMPVGLMGDAEFEVRTVSLEPGDKVVVYSDGVTEAQNSASEFFGRKRLKEVVVSNAGESCKTIHDAIHDAVAAYTEGAAQSDDITVLVLEIGF